MEQIRIHWNSIDLTEGGSRIGQKSKSHLHELPDMGGRILQGADSASRHYVALNDDRGLFFSDFMGCFFDDQNASELSVNGAILDANKSG